MCQALEDKDQIYILHTTKANLILSLPVSVNHYTEGKTGLLLTIGVLPAVQPHWTGGARTGLSTLYIFCLNAFLAPPLLADFSPSFAILFGY